MKQISLLLPLLCLLLSRPARAEQRHFYVTVFAYQSETDIRQAHTYAAFTAITGATGAALDDEHAWQRQGVVISWLPRELPMCISCPPVPGHNYTLPETFRIGIASGARLWALPTIEIGEDLYASAVAQNERLTGHGVLWVTVDPATRPKALNCLHAVSDVNRKTGPLYSGFLHGVPGSQLTLRHLAAGNEITGAPIPRWLPHALQLDQFPLNAAGR
jgi:hypothetical protein